MKKFMLVLLGSLLFAATAKAGEMPKTWAEFEKLTFAEMKDLPDVKVSLTKKMTAHDLDGKSETEIVLMKNSIYAQYGFRFSQKALANYFLSRHWYKADFASQNVDKLSKVAHQNVEFFLKYQADHKTGRDTASEHSWEESQLAFNLFQMGFCTYPVDGDPKAGLIVFEPGGVARVFHSKASRSQFAPYAYENYLDNLGEGYGVPSSLLIEAKWHLNIANDMAEVQVTFSKEDLDRYHDREGNAIIASGARRVLSVNLHSKDGNMYPWVKTKQCSMDVIK